MTRLFWLSDEAWAAIDPGCVKTLRGITAPGILGPMIMRRLKKRKNLSSARHYDQIRFRFRTAKIHICRAASLVSLASMIVVSSVASCTFSRPDAAGATCRLNTARRPRSTIVTTDGRSVAFGSVCSSRLQLLAMFLTNSASTVRM